MQRPRGPSLYHQLEQSFESFFKLFHSCLYSSMTGFFNGEARRQLRDLVSFSPILHGGEHHQHKLTFETTNSARTHQQSRYLSRDHSSERTPSVIAHLEARRLHRPPPNQTSPRSRYPTRTRPKLLHHHQANPHAHQARRPHGSLPSPRDGACSVPQPLPLDRRDSRLRGSR